MLLYSAFVYGGVQLLFAGVFAVQFFLTLLDPNRGKTVDLWMTLLQVHSFAYAIAVLLLFGFCLLWVRERDRTRWTGGPWDALKCLMRQYPNRKLHKQNIIEWWGASLMRQLYGKVRGRR